MKSKLKKIITNKPVAARTHNGAAITFKNKENGLKTKLTSIETSLPKTNNKIFMEKENQK